MPIVNLEQMNGTYRTQETTRGKLLQQGLRLEYVSLGWNALAGTGAVITGLSAASVALLGFGLAVAIDSLASLILVWRFWREVRGNKPSEQAEQKATRLVGITLLAAGVFIAGQAAHALLTHTASETSPAGVGIAVLSVGILPPLAYGKIHLASRLSSGALRGDGMLTAVGACLAMVTLLGLLVTTLLGWWWADPLAALPITGILLREGWRALSPDQPLH
jgi:divalent metal cation (Fe/Co/Zn/Cd) transporter